MLTIQTIDFKHGWCFLSFSDDGFHVEIDASSVLEDSMERLVLSAIAALAGKPYSFTFFEEPGMTPLRIECSDEGLFLVLDTKEIITTPLRYARQISALFARLKAALGMDGYLRQWGHPYPERLLERLSRAISDCHRRNA